MWKPMGKSGFFPPLQKILGRFVQVGNNRLVLKARAMGPGSA